MGGRGEPTSLSSRAARWTVGRTAWVLGGCATLAVLLTLADPGITVDEPLDVRPGRNYLATLQARGWGFFRPEVIDATYRDNAEHPPLGRWLLGVASTGGQPLEILLRGPDPVGVYIVAGRLAPALAFGVLVGVIALAAGRQSGRGAALVAGSSLVMMPRVFAHAHLAALDTFITLFWAVALLSFVWASRQGRLSGAMIAVGMLWGLALLTKIHAWFLPPVVAVWALSQLPTRRAVRAVTLWFVSGLVVFLVGWPWLWADPVGRLSAYLGTGVARVSIRVQYFGTIYADRAIPWHYPWFYFLTTVPVGLLGLAAWGTIQGGKERRLRATTGLWVGSIVLFLGLFSTNVAVYDGERLFLVVFPFLALLIGQGFAALWTARRRPGRTLLLGVVACQAVGVVWLHPFGLSYYNALVGGLPGAERLGLELTYWGDAVDEVLLDRLASQAQADDSAALVPTLAPNQGKFATTRRLIQIPLVIGDGETLAGTTYALVSRRSAYWSAAVRDRLASDQWVATRSRQGVWLAALLRRAKPTPSSRPAGDPYL